MPCLNLRLTFVRARLTVARLAQTFCTRIQKRQRQVSIVVMKRKLLFAGGITFLTLAVMVAVFGRKGASHSSWRKRGQIVFTGHGIVETGAPQPIIVVHTEKNP